MKDPVLEEAKQYDESLSVSTVLTLMGYVLVPGEQFCQWVKAAPNNKDNVFYLYYKYDSSYKFQYMICSAYDIHSKTITYTAKGLRSVQSLTRWYNTKQALKKRGFKRILLSSLNK